MSTAKSLSLAVLAAVCSLGSGASLAHSSEIGRSEAARLRYQYHQLQLAKRSAWADGEISRREHARISYQQQKLRRMIYIARNN